MNILSIKGNELFELENVKYDYDSEGKRRIVCNYSKSYGPKGSLKVVFEGFATGEVLRIKNEFTFKSLTTMFKDRRIYLQGVIFMDGQFEKSVDR
jgi:hypothetical protein